MSVTKLVRSAILATGLLGLAACGEAPTPTAAPGLEPYAALAAARGGPTVREIVVTWTLNPTQSYTLYIEGHRLKIPANSICDLATSGYGPGFWDRPCTISPTPVVLTATAKVARGTSEVWFTPDLRFAPTADASRYTILSMRDNGGKLDPVLDYNILWWSGTAWVDESLTDSTLKAWTERQANYVNRRVKHLSGYAVTARSSDGGEEGQ